MTKPGEAVSTVKNARDHIILALDVETAREAREIVRQLSGRVAAFKIGLQLFTAGGPELVREMTAAGVKVFLDLKFHDIPNTVVKASVEAARLGVWMFNVHTMGGSEMMRKTVDGVGEICERDGLDKPLIIGVTILTSSDEKTLQETGIGVDVESQVATLAVLAASSGLDGVVASPLEVRAVRNAVPDSGFLTVTPGIRPKLATDDDQKRVTTLRDAIANGSDYVVIGRPVTGSNDRSAALEQIVREAEGN